jgi:hypothetical protein
MEPIASSLRCVAASGNGSCLALVFCKKCKYFLLRHTSGDRFCVVNRPGPIYCRAPQGIEAVRSHVKRAPCRSSSGRCWFASPLWTYGSLSWFHGAVRDLHERSGFPHLRGDRRCNQVFPHRSHPSELYVIFKQRAVGLRSMRRYFGPSVGYRAHDPSGCDRSCGPFCHRPR